MNLTQDDSLEFTAKLLTYVAMTGREVARRGNVAKIMLHIKRLYGIYDSIKMQKWIGEESYSKCTV